MKQRFKKLLQAHWFLFFGLSMVAILSLVIFLISWRNLQQALQHQEEKTIYVEQKTQPVNLKLSAIPVLSGQSFFVFDINSKKTLAQNNSQKRMPIASTTKIMTALVSLDLYKPEEILTVKQIFNNGSIIGLQEGEQLTAKDLLQALLIPSANDAAQTLADNAPQQNFVELMNQKAAALRLAETHFSNPQGFDDAENYSTAEDLARITFEATKNQLFKKIVATKTSEISSLQGKKYFLQNVNELLNDPSFYGVKTGQTQLAGQCLVSLVMIKNQPILIVVLGSQDRFGDTLKLKNWLEENFIWVKPPAQKL